MISTLSKQGGRRYPQMGNTASIFVGRLLSIGETSGPVPPIPSGGGGGGGGWPLLFAGPEKRILRDRKRRKELREVIEKAFIALTKVDAPIEKIVAPYIVAERYTPDVVRVDFDRLLNNINAVQALLQAYAQMVDEDDEVLFYV